jgi:hypothetical protein
MMAGKWLKAREKLSFTTNLQPNVTDFGGLAEYYRLPESLRDTGVSGKPAEQNMILLNGQVYYRDINPKWKEPHSINGSRP